MGEARNSTSIRTIFALRALALGGEQKLVNEYAAGLATKAKNFRMHPVGPANRRKERK